MSAGERGGGATIALTVNGVAREVGADPWARLLDVLREELALTGTKEGCGEGECGACTVLLDGVPVNSCLVAIGQCGGRDVRTVEGLAAPATPSPGHPEPAPSTVRPEPFPSSVHPEPFDSGPRGGPTLRTGAVEGAMLNAVQRELVARGGAQCGICTPGIAVCASYLVEHGLAKAPLEEARAMVRQSLAGNICRCTGYQLIVDAVIAAAGEGGAR